MRGRAGLAILALVAAACGASGSSGAAPPPDDSPSSPTGSGTPGSYSTVEEMESAVEKAFVICNVPMKIYDPPEREGALAQADCRADISLLIFEPGDVQASAAAIQGEPEAQAIIVGDNWIVTCPATPGVCERIQGFTGGELLPAP